MRLNHPAPGRPLTSGYGPRKHPISGEVRKHRGLDWGGSFPVLAAGDGTVVAVFNNPNSVNGFGHGLIIQHAPALFTLYAHGARAPALRVGDKVRDGQFLFRSGSTGASTGDHLHFEVRTTPHWGSDVNPLPYLQRASDFAAMQPQPTRRRPAVFSIVPQTDGKIMLQSLVTARETHIRSPYHVGLLQRFRDNNSDDTMLPAEVELCQSYIAAVGPQSQEATGSLTAEAIIDELAARLSE